MASSVCCVVYASQEKLRVQSSLARAMLRGPVSWRFRIWFVLASRSQVMLPTQAGALTRLVAPPSVAISAKIPSMADCRVTCRWLSSAPAGERGSPRRARRGGRPGGPGRPSGSGRTEAPRQPAGRRRPLLPGSHVDGQLVDHIRDTNFSVLRGTGTLLIVSNSCQCRFCCETNLPSRSSAKGPGARLRAALVALRHQRALDR